MTNVDSRLERNALVTGAAGFLGAKVVRALLAHGFRVTALARSSSRAPRLQAIASDALRIVEADIVTSDLGALFAETVRHGVVVHCAAATGPNRSRKDCDETNVNGTARVLDAAIRAGASRFVNVSSLSVYGMAAGVFAEDAPLVRDGDPYGASKIAAEELCRNRGDEIDVVTVRPALIVGEGDTGFFPMFKTMLEKKRFLLLNGGRAAARLVSVDDVAAVIVKAAERAPAGAVYNVCAPGELSWRDAASVVCDAYGFKKPTFSMSTRLLYPVARGIEQLERAGLHPPIRKTDLQFLAEDRSYPMTRAEKELAHEPMDVNACLRLAMAAMSPMSAHTGASGKTRAEA